MAMKVMGPSRLPIQHEFSNRSSVEDVEKEQEFDNSISLQEEYKLLLRSYTNSIEKVSANGGMAQYWINFSHGQLLRFTSINPEFELPERHIVLVGVNKR